jgi:hypothetical protein
MSVPAGSGAAPSQLKSGVRAVRTVTKTYNYTLSIKPYPSGFNPPCQEVNPTVWIYYPGSGQAAWTDTSSQAGGNPPDINIGASCGLAHTGDSIHVLMEVVYGNPRFIAGSGNFAVDSVDDSHSNLTITDNTTGVSSQLSVFVSW